MWTGRSNHPGDAATTPPGWLPWPTKRRTVGKLEKTCQLPKISFPRNGFTNAPKNHAVSWISCRPSPALLGGFIASCCACCSSTRTGRRRASSRFLTMGMRNHTPLGLLTTALLSLTLSRARQVSWYRGLKRSGPYKPKTHARMSSRGGRCLNFNIATRISSWSDLLCLSLCALLFAVHRS